MEFVQMHGIFLLPYFVIVCEFLQRQRNAKITFIYAIMEERSGGIMIFLGSMVSVLNYKS